MQFVHFGQSTHAHWPTTCQTQVTDTSAPLPASEPVAAAGLFLQHQEAKMLCLH